MKLDTLERKPEDASDDSLNPANRHGGDTDTTPGSTDMSEFEKDFGGGDSPGTSDTSPGKTDMSDFEKDFSGGGSTNTKTKSADELKDAESKATKDKSADDTVGKGYSGGGKKGNSKTVTTSPDAKAKMSNGKKAGIGGILGMGLGVGAIGIGILGGGAAQVAMVADALHVPSSHNEQQQGIRVGTMLATYRVVQTGDIGEMRLTALGSKVFRPALQQLADAGVNFNRDSITGRPKSLTIDQEKITKQVSELKNVKPSSDTARRVIAEKLGVQVTAVTVTTDGKMNVNLQGSTQKSLRLLTDNSVKIIADSRAIGTAKSFFLKKAFGIYGLFHPFKKLTAAAEQKGVDALRARKEGEGKSPAEAAKEAKAEIAIENETNNVKETVKPFEAPAKAASDTVKASRSGFVSGVVKGLTFTGAACIVRDTAGAIATANREIVVLPAQVMAARILAADGQIKSGQGGVTIDQIGAMVQSWKAPDGSTISDGKAMQALANPNETPRGPDLPGEYQQAFNGKSTATTIKNGANEALGGSTIAAGVCSTPGLIAQGAIAIGLSVGAEVLSGGTATPAVAGLWTAKFVAQSAVSMVVVGAVIHIIENVAIDNQLPQKAFSGGAGGSLLAYGARELGNTTARSTMGMDLGNDDSTLLDTSSDDLGAPRSLADRLFNINDQHSLYYQAASTYYSSGFGDKGVASGIASVTQSLGDIGGMFGRTFGSLMPHASAAANYQWGFAQAGVPDKIMNNAQFEDPWASGAIAAKNILDGPNGNAYVDKVNDCFGVTVSKGSEGWDFTRDHVVDPTSDDYTNADCTADATVAGGSATDWQRVVMFGFDTLTLKDAACASGIDETVCADAGSSGSAPVTSTNPNTTGADQNGTGVQLDGISDLIMSNQFPGNTRIIPKVTNVVIHWLDANPESPEEAQAALAGNGGTSVQFYVSQSGKIMQLTPYANSNAGHAKNANDFAVGIEIGSPNDSQIGDSPPYPKLQAALMNNATQKAQVIKLATALAKKFGITTVTVGNQVLYNPTDTCAALGLSFPGTCATQAEASRFGIVGHYQLQNTKSDPGPDYIQEIQKGVKANLGL